MNQYISGRSLRAAIAASCMFVASARTPAQALGDDCSNPVVVLLAPGVTTSVPYNAAGYAVPGPAAPCSGTVSDFADVWFVVTSPVDGVVIASLCPGSLLAGALPPGPGPTPADTYLAAWDGGACPPVVNLACADGSPECGITEAEIQFPALAGIPYFVQLGSFGGAPNSGVLNFAVVAAGCSPVPPNDLPSSALVLGLGVSVPYTTMCGTDYFIPPPASPPCGTTSHDVWFCFTPSATGKLKLEILGGKKMTVGVWDAIPTTTNPAPALGCGTSGPAIGGVFPSAMAMTTVCGGRKYWIAVSDGGGFSAFMVKATVTFEKKTYYDMSTFKMEAGSGDPNVICFHAVTIDLVHPGIPPAVSFPNGWFFGVPLTLLEFISQLTWGGLPYWTVLDATGSAVFIQLPPGSLTGLVGATIWSVAITLDPLTGMVAEVSSPEAFVI